MTTEDENKYERLEVNQKSNKRRIKAEAWGTDGRIKR